MLSSWIVIEAARLGTPGLTLLRMAANVIIDTLGGSVPVVGDLFDAVWKSNTWNVRLLESHLTDPHRARRATTRLLVGLGIGAAVLAGAAAGLGVWMVVELVRVLGRV